MSPQIRSALVSFMSCLTRAPPLIGRLQMMMLLRYSHRPYVKRVCVWSVCISVMPHVQWHTFKKPVCDAVSMATPSTAIGADDIGWGLRKSLVV